MSRKNDVFDLLIWIKSLSIVVKMFIRNCPSVQELFTDAVFLKRNGVTPS